MMVEILAVTIGNMFFLLASEYDREYEGKQMHLDKGFWIRVLLITLGQNIIYLTTRYM